MRVHQRYSYLGLSIVFAMGAIVTWLICGLFFFEQPVKIHNLSVEALEMQCHERDGMVAVADGAYGTDVSCYQGKKKIWRVIS